MEKTTKAYVAITLQSLIIGLSFLVVKIALENANTTDLLAHRFSAAAISVWIFNFFRKNKVHIEKSDWLKILPYSLAYPICFFLFQTIGLGEISSSQAGIVNAIAPILTLIIAKIILGEEIKNSQKLLMILSVFGVIFINIMNGFSMGDYSYIGFIFILLSVISFSTYNVLVKKLTKTYSSFTIAYVMSTTGFIVFNLISIIDHIIKGDINNYFEPFTHVSFILAVLYLGVLSSLITTLLLTYALSGLEASKVGLFNNVATVVSIFAGSIFLREPLYYYHYIGIAAILVGTIGFNLLSTKPTLTNSSDEESDL